MRLATAAIIAGAIVVLAGAPTGAQARWERLGCQKVGFLADKDVIRVGRGEGSLNPSGCRSPATRSI
jgi:hypothetical protein